MSVKLLDKLYIELRTDMCVYSAFTYVLVLLCSIHIHVALVEHLHVRCCSCSAFTRVLLLSVLTLVVVVVVAQRPSLKSSNSDVDLQSVSWTTRFWQVHTAQSDSQRAREYIQHRELRREPESTYSTERLAESQRVHTAQTA